MYGGVSRLNAPPSTGTVFALSYTMAFPQLNSHTLPLLLLVATLSFLLLLYFFLIGFDDWNEELRHGDGEISIAA